jgi:hypothetical protein
MTNFPNPNQIPMTNVQGPKKIANEAFWYKSRRYWDLVIGIWDFDWDLGLGHWDFSSGARTMCYSTTEPIVALRKWLLTF